MKEAVEILSKRLRFTKGDTKVFLDGLIDLLEEYARENKPLKIRGLGKLYSQKIPPRKGKDGQALPETRRIIFRLSENIRFPNREKSEIDPLTNDE